MQKIEPKISIVTTIYNSEKYLTEFTDKCIMALEAISCNNFELIFVNDASPDASLNLLLEIKKKIPQITILDLARNFGHHYATFAGLQYSKGDYVFLIDCDLELSPEILEQFYTIMVQQNADVVYGYQAIRKGKFVERLFGNIFWKTINRLSDIEIPENIVTERLMTRKYVDSLLRLGDKNLFLGGMMYWVGHNQIGTPVRKQLRKEQSSYSLIHRIKLMLEAVTSFSTVPLRMLFFLGLILTSVSFCWASYLFIQKILRPDMYLSGYISLVIIIIFLTGTIQMSLGLLGLYLGKVFKQVQNRPLYIVKSIY